MLCFFLSSTSLRKQYGRNYIFVEQLEHRHVFRTKKNLQLLFQNGSFSHISVPIEEVPKEIKKLLYMYGKARLYSGITWLITLGVWEEIDHGNFTLIYVGIKLE